MNGSIHQQILALSAITSFILPIVPCAPANAEGFTETFENPALPGWEVNHAHVVNGTLRVEPGGSVFRPGPWRDFTLILRAKYNMEGQAIVSYRTGETGEYALQLGAGFITLSRVGQRLGRASHEIPPDEWAAIEIAANGGSQAVKLNGRAVISASDPDPLASGGLFLRADMAAAEFDDLTIRSPLSTQLPAYQAKSWVAMGGPPGDLGYDIRYNFNDPNIWYVTDGQGGFFISTDRGQTWKASNEGIGGLESTMIRTVFSATVDPHDPQIIWIGTQLTGHIYKSTDGGQTWTQKDNGVTPNQGHHFRGFTVDPRSSDIVYAQAEVECYVFKPACTLPQQGGRVYRTTNGGEKWDIVWEGDALARYLWIDPTNPDVLYVSTGIFDRDPLNISTDLSDPNRMQNSGVGVVKSTNGGTTWTELGKANGLTNLYVGSLYMHPKDPRILLAGTGHAGMVKDPDTGKEVMYGGVFLTTDGGQMWKQVVKNDMIGAVEFCHQDPSIAYAAGWLAAYRSEDGGHTWKRFGDEQRETWGPKGLWPGVPIDMQTDPDDCKRVFINNYVGGNFLSTDGAETWSLASTGYSGAKVTDLWVDPQDASHVYAAVRMAPFVSHDGARTWQGLSDEVIKTSVSVLAGNPSNGNHLLATQGHPGRPASHFITRDGGQSWTELAQLTVPAELNEITDWYDMGFWDYAFAPSDPNIVYAATMNKPFPAQSTVEKYPGVGIYRSEDSGATWAPANDSSTANEGFGAVVVHPADPQTVYAAGYFDAGLFKTTDGGRTWTPINGGLTHPYPPVVTMAVASDSPNAIFVGGRTGVFRTTNGGGSWKQLAAGLDPFAEVTALAIDPSNGQNVYVGSSRQGVFYSTDGGNTFQQLRQGLDPAEGTMPVISLALSGDGTVLYAGTAGQGVWQLGTPPENSKQHP